MDERVAGALAALVAYILWRRNVLQNAWGALWGASERQALGTDNQSMVARLIASGTQSDVSAETAQNLGSSTYPGSPNAGDIWAQSGCNRGNYSCLHAWQQGGGVNPSGPPVGGDIGARIIAAEPAGLAKTINRYGSDLWNWCLAFVNKVRQSAGLPIGPYGAQTAAGACSQLTLRPGIAPAGATVCFSGGPAGHIGIADGGDSYTSAGLIHGGTVRRPYASNPGYMGWTF